MPLLFQPTPHSAIWKMDESAEELLALLHEPFRYPSIREVAHSEHRLKERLTSLVLLKTLSGRETEIRHAPSGAPFLADERLHLSLSHTKGYAALILRHGEPTGIDLEYRSDRVRRIRSRFLSPEEEAAIDPRHETEHLLLHWCAKETLFKIIHQSEVDFRAHLHIRPFPFRDEGSLAVWESRTQQQEAYRLDYRVEADFVLTWRAE